MVDVEEVECEFCGAVIPLSKVMKMDPKNGTYIYKCPHCSKKWDSN